MRYVLLAALMFLLGALAMTFEGESASFIPIVRVRSTEGLYITLVQARTPKRSACQVNVETFVKALDSTCANCAVESSDCATQLHGIDQALAAGEQLPIYTVAADGVRIGVVGPPNIVRAACEGMATQFVVNGWKMATCVAPVMPKT